MEGVIAKETGWAEDRLPTINLRSDNEL